MRAPLDHLKPGLFRAIIQAISTLKKQKRERTIVRAVFKLVCVAAALGSALWASATAGDAQTQKIRERIKPVGDLCLEGQPCADAVATTQASGPRDGKAVFDTFCTACHTAGVLGAPKAFDKTAWDAKFAKGFETSLANAINGINAMPPRGTCGDCTDEEISNAIKYMSKPK